MTQRLLSKMRWLLILAVYAGPNWNPVKAGSVKTPPKNPSTIEAQAKYFQDFFSVQLSPYKIEFGHVCEDPNTWQQRYEKKDFKNHRDMGKVRWGDKHGGYGEHYWDLNHAGHAADNDNGYEGNSDDGSYREDNHRDDHSDVYEEPSEYSPSYDDGYDPEKAAAYDESGRAKRAHTKSHTKLTQSPVEETHHNQDENYENSDEDDEDVEEETESPPPKRRNVKSNNHHNRQRNDEVIKKTVTTKGHKSYPNPQEKPENKDDKNQVVLVLSHKNKQGQEENQQKVSQSPHQYQTPSHHPSSHVPYDDGSRVYQTTHTNPSGSVPHKDNSEDYQPNSKQPSSYVPYEGGSGVRQHRLVGASAPPQIPRLFLEPSTGHIVDRATGQAFVLQPIADANYN